MSSSEVSERAAEQPLLPPLSPLQAADGWDECKRQIDALLRVAEPDAAWVTRLKAAAQRMRTLFARDQDAGVYLLMQTAATELDRYSAHHAMLCALVAELCAAWFEWSVEETEALVHAAPASMLRSGGWPRCAACTAAT